MKTLLTAALALAILAFGERRHIDGLSVWAQAEQGYEDICHEWHRFVNS